MAPLAGPVEPPEFHRYAQNHGGNEVLDEQGARDQVHQRRTGKERGDQHCRFARQPLARSTIEQRDDRHQQREIEEARRGLAANEVDDGVSEIGGHRHDRPHEQIGTKCHNVVRGDVGRHGEMHGETVGAVFRLERGEPVDAENEQQQN